MAYDPKDPADKKIVDDLIAKALADAKEELDDYKAGVDKKNKELLKKIKELREGKGDADEVTALEAQLETVQAELKTVNKALKDITKERDNLKVTSEAEGKFSRDLLIENGLTEALVASKVGEHYLPAAKKLLADQVDIKTEGATRSVVTKDGKPLREFVTAWAQSDQGKHFVIATANGGGNSPGGNAPGSNQTDLSKLPPMERITAYRDQQAARK